MYTQLLAIIDLVVKQAIITTDHFESEFVSKTFTLNPFPCYCAFFFGLVFLLHCSKYFLFIFFCKVEGSS